MRKRPGAGPRSAAAALRGFVLVPRLPALRRRLVGRTRRVGRVRAAAEAAFHTHRVTSTRDRTGVLVFVSLFEREVVVLPDIGIEARTPESAWADVVARVVAGMKAGRPADGIVETVRACGELLRAAGFVARPDDVDEIEDAPRIAR